MEQRGLGPRQAETVRAFMPVVLGLEGADLEHVDVAVDKLSDFLRVQEDERRADELRQLIDALGAVSITRFGALPGALGKAKLNSLVEELFDRDRSVAERLVEGLVRVSQGKGATLWDLARSLREIMAVAYWSNPSTDAISGYVPVWEREEVLAADPSVREASPYTTHGRSRLDVGAIRTKLTPAPAQRDYFANDGRPRVAIIGSGPGGAAAAAALAPHADVVVFEAGARFAPAEMPLDTMAAMSLLYEGGLMTPTKDLDVRVLRPRAVGGGSIMNEGVTVRPRARTLDAWGRAGAGFDRGDLERALDDVERRQRFRPVADDRATFVGPTWRRGLEALPDDVMVAPVLSDLATHVEQHAGSPFDDLKGDRCLGCGLCNSGCRFGHHLTVDRTFLYDAELAGARVVEKARVQHLVSAWDPKERCVRITGLRLAHAAPGETVDVDHVVLAAGTPGSSALLLRSVSQGALRRIRPARAKRIGAGFGFNVGAPTLAVFRDRPDPPGFRGVQTHFVATKAEDEGYILENGHIPPGVMAGTVPGFGADHRRLMGRYSHLAMAVNTIGTASTGRVDRRGDITFSVSDGTTDTLRRTLALLIDGWLHSGADEVWTGGVSPLGGPQPRFDTSFKGHRDAIQRRLEQTIQRPEDVQIGSGHPQGGLALNDDPEVGVVGSDYRVHDTDNLYVADASLFPTTIVVNLQWLVMGMGLAAGRSLAGRLAAG